MQIMNESTCIDSPISISSELVRKFKEGSIGQPEIAEKSGVSQSQVSRILSGKFKRRSKNVDSICKYAKLVVFTPKVDPMQNKALMDALSSAWDGTEDHAKILVNILNSVRNLRKLNSR